MLGLPETLDGMFTDTASVSSLMSLVAARHTVPGLDSRDRGLAGRADTKRLRMYASAEAHGSIDKGAIVAGIGREGVRHIESDAGFRMRPEALARAIEEDRRADWLPFCVVGTMGTTSSASIDPAAPIADICEREGLWFHVDAAYGGAAALAAEKRPLFAGWERADSIVVNAHKWMFTPFDASILFFKHPDRFREAFSLVPEYLKGSRQEGAHNYNEYGMQLGRRFRALKVWMQLRYFGAEGMAARIREHCAMATELADRVAAEPDWEVMAPVDLALVCLRHCPPGLKGDQLDRHNDRILDEVNATGQIYLSHTRLDGRYAIRVALGNPRATRDHVDLCWRLLRESAEKT